MTTQPSTGTVAARREDRTRRDTARRDVATPRIPLSRRWRRVILVGHVVAGGAWIGIDVIVAVLVLTGWFADDTALRSLAYRALAEFVVSPMLVSGLLCLVTGLLLGLGTKWGLVRYWWVLVKLVLNLALCTLIVVVLQPAWTTSRTTARTCSPVRRRAAACPDCSSRQRCP